MKKKISEVVKFTSGAGCPQPNSPENLTVEIERQFHGGMPVKRSTVKKCAEISRPKAAS
jgi:hypothetical protein